MIHHDTRIYPHFPFKLGKCEKKAGQKSSFSSNNVQKCFDNLIDFEVSSRKYLEVSSHRLIILYCSPTHFQPDIHLSPGKTHPSVHPKRFWEAGHLFGAKATNIPGDHESATLVAATTRFAFGQLCHICQLHVGLTAITYM